MSRNQVKRCACGLPLHYRDKAREAEVQAEVDTLGEWMPFSIGHERYLVQRHYKELHGLDPTKVDALLKSQIIRRNNK
jgi:hypothetical protein